MDLKPSVFNWELEELEAWMRRAGQPAYRAKQLLEWMYAKGISKFAEAKNLPAALIEKLEAETVLHTLEPDIEKKDLEGESNKFVFRTRDGRFLESVLISQRDRQTVCVSTQLGCKIGCTFCASGKGKFGRNLTAGEIVEQVMWIQKRLGTRVSNVVYMGMGEPLDNFDATMKSLRLLQSPQMLALGARHITVSTSGLTPKIAEFVAHQEGRVRLSVSLHSSIEAKRSELVPINRKYPLKELVEMLGRMKPELSRRITFEYTLMEGENDSEEEVKGLVQIARPLNALINVIPYNPIREMQYRRPSDEKIREFRAGLVRRGVRVIVRQTAGRSIDAACGQLRLDREAAA